MPTLYLHIGMNKAGSSAIQSYFHSNRKRLEARGLLWPETGLGGRDRGAGCHFALSDSLGFGPSTRTGMNENDLLEMRDQLIAEIEASAPKSVVMSSEFFVLNRDMSRVRRFFEGFDVKVVLFLRRHDHWWASLFAQAIKTTSNPPWNRSFKGFYDFQTTKKRQHLCFGPFVQLWAGAFGQENVLVCPYEDEQLKPDLLRHFLALVGRPEVGDAVPPSGQRINEALSPRSLSLIDLIQRANIDQTTKNSIVEQVIKEDKLDRGATSIVPPKMRHQLIEENLNDYEYIAREFLNRPDAQLFYELYPPEVEANSNSVMLPAPRPVEFFAGHFRP